MHKRLPNNFDAVGPILSEGYEAQRKDNQAFERIDPPAEDRRIIEQLTTAYDEQTALVGRLADAADAGDVERFTTLSDELERVRTRARGLAQGYGFRECGSGKNEAD